VTPGLIAFAAMATAAAPQTILTADPKHQLVEGISSDGATIWLSSVLDRQILTCRAKCRTFATLPVGIHPFAIAWDAGRKRLWVAADCPQGVPGIKACSRGALIAYGASGRLLTRIAPAAGDFHPGDVSASAAGVFVSDSKSGAVYSLTKRSYSLAALVPAGVGKSAQGSAADEQGKTLLVADYSQGIAAVDLASGERTLLPRQDGKPLRGIDGLVRCGSTYYGVYNGTAPGTLVSIARTAQGIRFEQPLGEVELPDPTQIAFDGKRLLILTRSGWDDLGKAPKRARGAEILAVPLSGNCTPL